MNKYIVKASKLVIGAKIFKRGDIHTQEEFGVQKIENLLIYRHVALYGEQVKDPVKIEDPVKSDVPFDLDGDGDFDKDDVTIAAKTMAAHKNRNKKKNIEWFKWQ